MAEHGGAIAGMPGLGASLADLTLFSLDRGMFGSRGDLLAEDRFITFRSDRSFRRLKETKTIPFPGITSLDGFFARILERFLTEIDERSGVILSKESAICSLSDQFDRLTALWYVRQIARLHFADEHADPASIRPWSLSVLTPRALQAGGRLSIRLRERSLNEEEIRTLRS